jgi:hypothetical protein
MRARVEQELSTAMENAKAEHTASTKAAEDVMRKVLRSSNIRLKASEAKKEELTTKSAWRR